jgi:hypothetical protein
LSVPSPNTVKPPISLSPTPPTPPDLPTGHILVELLVAPRRPPPRRVAPRRAAPSSWRDPPRHTPRRTAPPPRRAPRAPRACLSVFPASAPIRPVGTSRSSPPTPLVAAGAQPPARARLRSRSEPSKATLLWLRPEKRAPDSTKCGALAPEPSVKRCSGGLRPEPLPQLPM